jgi:hypothetical protein
MASHPADLTVFSLKAIIDGVALIAASSQLSPAPARGAILAENVAFGSQAPAWGRVIFVSQGMTVSNVALNTIYPARRAGASG